MRASEINSAIRVAAVHALRDLARAPVPAAVVAAYGGQSFEFGPDYIIPKPLNPRLLGVVSAAVARAAVDSGVSGWLYPAHYPLATLSDIEPRQAAAA